MAGLIPEDAPLTARPQFVTRMRPAEFIALSACTMALMALGIDIMLPAFGTLRHHFGLGPDSTATSQIIAFFFIGQAAQIVFGPLSDRYGRLAVLRVGFPLYIAGGIGAAVAPSLGWMLAARFVAGMGASALFMITIAGVRDRFVGDRMARTMSLIFTIFLFTPIVAPFLGTAILSLTSWQGVFLTPPLVAVVVFLWSLRLEESLPPERRLALEWQGVLRSARRVVGNRTFLRYAGITTILWSGLSSYVASSERIVGEIFDRPELFAWIFAGLGVVTSLSTFLNAQLAARFGARRSLRGLLTAYASVAGLLLVLTLASGDPPGMLVFFVLVSVLTGLNLAIEPNSSALALEPLGAMAGMAAAIYGTSFFVFGSIAGAFISGLLVHGVLPLVLSYFVLGLVTLSLALSDHRRPAAESSIWQDVAASRRTCPQASGSLPAGAPCP
jgi:MFS transporter, DHA1 family, multidrug resistance protein